MIFYEEDGQWRSKKAGNIEDVFAFFRAFSGEEIQTGPQHPMFEELHTIDNEFNQGHIYGSSIEAAMERGVDTINAYIETISRYKDQITPEMLVDPQNRFADNVDPVFAFLIRAMCGPEMITPEVFEKVRKAWCGDDIPLAVGKILEIKDDHAFVRAFERAALNPRDNVKLTVLRKMGIMSTLVNER